MKLIDLIDSALISQIISNFAQILNVLTQSLSVILAVLLFCSFALLLLPFFDPGFNFARTSSQFGKCFHLSATVSIDFSANPKENNPFHHTAYDYSLAY